MRVTTAVRESPRQANVMDHRLTGPVTLVLAFLKMKHVAGS